MNLTAKNRQCINYTIGESSLFSKMALVLDACECCTNLMVSIYLIKKERFIFLNEKLKGCLGDNFAKFFKEGWAYWYSLIDKQEAATVKNGITKFLSHPFDSNLHTLNYHITDGCSNRIYIKHDILLHQFEEHFLAISYYIDITEKEKIENCFEHDVDLKEAASSINKVLTISPREKQVLSLIADGYSSKEIADMLYISNHTAISHRKNLIEKFQVKNTAHLIKRALEFIRI